nr:immunoglobulin heavy chain junction region [Macaca mulatta]MOV47395.1 immunoglobulin heavy chain junction region [Macaca mulatta]MOV47469.1 immunoglobulin heavy chain junction region [Macaca mulatta]MOV47518.1 immunoglobulin heavy chain junction region [Macaca mulatta]MOV47527.1 immunoglobulin heavy chain junction region [Macaca mulatta]
CAKDLFDSTWSMPLYGLDSW